METPTALISRVYLRVVRLPRCNSFLSGHKSHRVLTASRSFQTFPTPREREHRSITSTSHTSGASSIFIFSERTKSSADAERQHLPLIIHRKNKFQSRKKNRHSSKKRSCFVVSSPNGLAVAILSAYFRDSIHIYLRDIKRINELKLK